MRRPTTLVGPNLFLLGQRKTHSSPSWSSLSTTSTLCSIVLGPATSPRLVRRPTSQSVVPVVLAWSNRRSRHVLSCAGSPGRSLTCPQVSVWIVSIATARARIDQGAGVNLRALVTKHGATGKLVRAICAAQGWRWTKNGAPAQWYDAWRAGLGAEIEATLQP